MLLHCYGCWQRLGFPICLGSLHRLLFVHLIDIPGNIPQLGLDWFMMAKKKRKTKWWKMGKDMIVTGPWPHFHVSCGSDLIMLYVLLLGL